MYWFGAAVGLLLGYTFRPILDERWAEFRRLQKAWRDNAWDEDHR